MSLDDRTAQEKLTPEERRTMLRALADRMLLKAASLDDPEDMADVEKTVRVAAGIERIYYRCDRAERQTTDPRKVEAERATNQSAAIKARVALASDLEWGEQRHKQLGKWWYAADTATPAPVVKPVVKPAAKPTVTSVAMPATAPQGLRQSVLTRLDAAFDALVAAPSQDASPHTDPDIRIATGCMLDAQAALEQGDLSEDDFDTIEDAVNDWLKKRPPPS